MEDDDLQKGEALQELLDAIEASEMSVATIRHMAENIAALAKFGTIFIDTEQAEDRKRLAGLGEKFWDPLFTVRGWQRRLDAKRERAWKELKAAGDSANIAPSAIMMLASALRLGAQGPTEVTLEPGARGLAVGVISSRK